MMMNVLLSKIIDEHLIAVGRPPKVLKLYPAMAKMLEDEYQMFRSMQGGRMTMEFEGIPIEIIPLDLI